MKMKFSIKKKINNLNPFAQSKRRAHVESQFVVRSFMDPSEVCEIGKQTNSTKGWKNLQDYERRALKNAHIFLEWIKMVVFVHLMSLSIMSHWSLTNDKQF